MTTPQRAILAPLLGLGMGWSLFMFAAWSNLFIQPIYDASGFVSDPSVRPSTYLYLLGIALFSLGSFIGLRMSRAERERDGGEAALALAAYRFATLSVIIALAGGAIFAIANFLTALGNRNDESLAARIGGVYVPIILAAALVIVLLLFSFVVVLLCPSAFSHRCIGRRERRNHSEAKGARLGLRDSHRGGRHCGYLRADCL